MLKVSLSTKGIKASIKKPFEVTEEKSVITKDDLSSHKYILEPIGIVSTKKEHSMELSQTSAGEVHLKHCVEFKKVNPGS